ncbi:MAG: hypothetical protein ACI87O_002963, partial [Planctomycetota bacterium]
ETDKVAVHNRNLCCAGFWIGGSELYASTGFVRSLSVNLARRTPVTPLISSVGYESAEANPRGAVKCSYGKRHA